MTILLGIYDHFTMNLEKKIKHGLTNPSMASTSNERQAVITQNTTSLNHVMSNASVQCYRLILKAVRSYL